MENLKVYGIEIDACNENADSLFDMTPQERYEKLVEGNKDNLESYTLERFFYYLNGEMIDTENKFWFIAGE